MTHLHALAVLAATTTTAAGAKKGSSSVFFIFILVLFVAVYFLYLRPRQQRAKQARTQAAQLSVGDSVMSVGGIIGTVVGIEDGEVRVEVAPGVVMTFIRRAINMRQPPPAPSAADSAADADAAPPETPPHDEAPGGPDPEEH
jgi:preprotein translocase subunit YajC